MVCWEDALDHPLRAATAKDVKGKDFLHLVKSDGKKADNRLRAYLSSGLVNRLFNQKVSDKSTKLWIEITKDFVRMSSNSF